MGFHAVIFNNEQMMEIPALARKHGITSFKFITDSSHKELYPGTGVYGVDDAGLYVAFEEIASLGYPARAMIHAENTFIAKEIETRVKKTGRNDLAAWSNSRPTICWEEPVWRVGLLAQALGCPVGIAHAVTPEVIGRLRSYGVDIVAEACLPYLAFTKHSPLGSAGKLAPPLLDKEGVEKLWEAIREGHISFVGTDHVPQTKSGKTDDIWKSRSASPGTALILPVMLNEGVRKGRIPMEKVAEITSYNTARIFGLYPQKGIIAVGSDADLVIVDMEKEVTISYETMHDTVSDFSVFDGMTVQGWPTLTMVRGAVAMENGTPTGQPGHGRYLYRRLHT
jgi:dihydroorotase-like cyclic amidohydrolase